MIKHILVYKIHNRGLRGLDLETRMMVSTKNRVVFGLIEFDTVTFEVEKEWDHGRTTYLIGKVLEHRYDPSVLNIPGHNITFVGKRDYSYLDEEELGDICNDGEEDEFEDTDDFLTDEYVFDDYTSHSFSEGDTDPIREALEASSRKEEYNILCALWEDQPMCIDALVHIGHIYFRRNNLNAAERFYSIALTIAERNIPIFFDGVLPYEHLENRPYHRALHGMCLTRWRQGRFTEAIAIAEKGYLLNPMDNIGFRFLFAPITNHQSWEEYAAEEEQRQPQ